jgi:hypothetical protein
MRIEQPRLGGKTLTCAATMSIFWVSEERHMAEAPIVRGLDEAAGHNKDYPAFVEVPGKYVAGLVKLLETIRHPGQASVSAAINALDTLEQKGVVVTNIGPKSQAAKAGMARGDQILRYNGVQLGGSEKLKDVIRRIGPSKRVTLDAVRRGKKLAFEVHGGPLGITVQRLG